MSKPRTDKAGESIENLEQLAYEAARIGLIVARLIRRERERGRTDTRHFVRFDFVPNPDPMTQAERPRIFDVVESHDAKSQTIIRLSARLEAIAYRIRVDSGIWTKNQKFEA